MQTPIVGCPGLDDPAAAEYANRWFLVDEQLCWLLDPLLDSVDLTIRHGMLVIKAPGMLRLDIPMDVIEDDDSVRMTAQSGSEQVDVIDEGDLAAVWFSNLIGRSCRLVKVHPDATVPDFYKQAGVSQT